VPTPSRRSGGGPRPGRRRCPARARAPARGLPSAPAWPAAAGRGPLSRRPHPRASSTWGGGSPVWGVAAAASVAAAAVDARIAAAAGRAAVLPLPLGEGGGVRLPPARPRRRGRECAVPQRGGRPPAARAWAPTPPPGGRSTAVRRPPRRWKPTTGGCRVAHPHGCPHGPYPHRRPWHCRGCYGRRSPPRLFLAGDGSRRRGGCQAPLLTALRQHTIAASRHDAGAQGLGGGAVSAHPHQTHGTGRAAPADAADEATDAAGAGRGPLPAGPQERARHPGGPPRQ